MTKKLKEPSIRTLRKMLRDNIVNQYRIYYERNHPEDAKDLVKLRQGELKTLNIADLIRWNNGIVSINGFEDGKRMFK